MATATAPSTYSGISRPRAGQESPTPPERVLTLASVLEEEFAALHPDEPQASVRPAAAFTADDIADLPGFARALLDSPVLGAFVTRGQPRLAELLRLTLVDEAGPRPDDPLARGVLAGRLTDLLSEDLEQEPAFAPLIESLLVDDEGLVATRPPRECNRLLLEAAFAPFLVTTHDRRLASIIARIHTARHSALCLSGGGIRSASFAMGVVQGLAQRGLLARFDYLSTVSGGGYTGSWLSAWMARSGTDHVNAQLGGAHTGKPDPEPAPLRHIRAYSAFLNPSFGLAKPTRVSLGLREPVLWADGQPLRLDDAHDVAVEPKGIVGRTEVSLLLLGPPRLVKRYDFPIAARPATRIELGVDALLAGLPFVFVSLWRHPGVMAVERRPRASQKPRG